MSSQEEKIKLVSCVYINLVIPVNCVQCDDAVSVKYGVCLGNCSHEKIHFAIIFLHYSLVLAPSPYFSL